MRPKDSDPNSYTGSTDAPGSVYDDVNTQDSERTDAILNALANTRRRQTVRLLDAAGQPVTLRWLSEQLSALRYDVSVSEISSGDRKNEYVLLYQHHLDVLDEAGLVSWEGGSGTRVEPTEALDKAISVLDQLSGAADAGLPLGVERLIPDGGQTPPFDRVAVGQCDSCGEAEVPIRFLEDGECVGCRYGKQRVVADGGDDELPAGVVVRRDGSGRRILHGAAESKTVACPECDTGGKLVWRFEEKCVRAPSDALWCSSCSWTGAMTAANLREINYGSNRGVASPKEGTAARKLLESDPDVLPDGGMVEYLLKAGCPDCGTATTFVVAHESEIPVDQDLSVPAEHCPCCRAHVPAHGGWDLREEARVERVSADGGCLQVCPRCDSTAIRRRHGSMAGPDVTLGDTEARYYCSRCSATFDEPTLREPRANQPAGTSPTAQKLVEADPDDALPVEGGDE